MQSTAKREDSGNLSARVLTSLEIKPGAADLQEELEKANTKIDFLKKHNSILQLGLQKNAQFSSLFKW